MRSPFRVLLPLLGSVVLMTACGPGYTSGGVVVGGQAGGGIDVFGYSSAYYGDWHTNYRQWTPTTVYESNGQYYPNKVRGGRQVQVYRTSKGYVMPPRDADLTHTDHRLKSKQMPNDADYSRARPHPGS
ncbi:MAG TPA: hypothetical protein VGM77_07330 [Gemmatimonadales bacterium]|jgi:hypothetical protein